MFQFQVWKKSLDVKYVVNSTVILIIAFGMLSLSNALTNWSKSVKSELVVINNLISQQNTGGAILSLEAEYAKMQDLSNDYMFYLHFLLSLCVLTYSYSVRDFQEILYCHLRKIHVQIFNYQLLINFINSGIVTYWFIKNFTIYEKDFNGIKEELKSAIVIERMNEDNSFDIQVILTLLVSIQFLRLLISLEVSRTFGPMIKILGTMFVDVVVFLVLFATIFLIFLAIGQLLFEELNEFTSPIDTAKTLFTIWFGGFAYSVFNTLSNSLRIAGYIYLTVFIFFVAIVLINFLIAILSNTYEILKDVSNGLYLRRVLQLRQVYDYNRLYSSIIFATPPLNFLSIVTFPLTLYMKSRKFNRIILIIQYIPICVISVLLFSIISLLISPLSYMLILVQSLKHLFKRPLLSAKDLAFRALNCISNLLVGYFQLFFCILLDIINFSLMLFAYKITYISNYEEEKQDTINREMDGSIKEDTKQISAISTQFIKLQTFKLSQKNIKTNFSYFNSVH